MSCRRLLGITGIVGLIASVGLLTHPALADDTPQLRYGFQKGQDFIYHVKIVAELPDETLTEEGNYNCNILDSAEKQFTLKVSGALGRSVKAKPGMGGGFGPPRFPGPPRFQGPPRMGGPFGRPMRPLGTTIGRQGNLIVAGHLTDLPLLLGCAEMLFIEPFPTDAKSAWDTQTGLGIVEHNQSSWHHIGPFSETEIAHGATERIDFNVLETKPDTVRISKKYALHTTGEANGVSKIEMSGDGEFSFDRKQGLITSQTMKFEIKFSLNNVNVTIPMTLNYTLLSVEEVAAFKKKTAEEAAGRAEAARPKPLTAMEHSLLPKDLISGDGQRVKAAAERLGKSIRDEQQPEVISRALCRAMKTADDWTKPMLMNALKVWATPDAEATIVEAAKQRNVFLAGPAIEALENFKTPAAAEAVAAALSDGSHRGNAAKALKKMGRVAEPFVIPHLSSHDLFTRHEACDILAAAGGKRALQALKTEIARAEWHEKDRFQKAIAAIEARLESGADDTPEPTAGAAPASGPKTRTWYDVTKTYKIEASLVTFEDGKVTLRRPDGSTLTLPLTKLSAEDRDFVQKYAKPPNPFE